MASLTGLVSSFDVNSKEFEWLVHDLMVDNNDVPFDSHEVETVQNAFVKSVNSRINQAGCDFLPILERILPACSKETFSKYGLFWIVNATKVLENVHSSARDLILACKVLGALVEHCKEIPELHKQISMQHVKQLINVLSALQTDAKCGAVYYLLAVLLYHYSEVCERFQVPNERSRQADYRYVSLRVYLFNIAEIPGFKDVISIDHWETFSRLQLRSIKQCIHLAKSLLYLVVDHFGKAIQYHSDHELIRKTILFQIDSKQENLVNASARCYVLLSKATERSFKPPPSKSVYTATTYNEALLCNNLHAIMDELFSGLIELESVDIWDQLELPPISNKDTIQYYNGQRQRFANVCIYLSSMLRGYEARNSVLPHDILGVLCRGLAVTPLNLKDKSSFKEQMLYVILPKLHISLLTVLDAFINGFAQELVPYGETVLQLFQQTLQWTGAISEKQMTFSDSKPFRNVRICAYKCLCSWLINTSSLSGIETIANECVTYILKDVTPERDCILLSMQQKTQHLSKRAVKRFKHSQYENSTILNNGEGSPKSGEKKLDADLCKEALTALQNILFSGSVLLKQTFYKNVQNTVIPLLYNLYLSSAEQNFYKNHNVCRLELFRVLKALQMNPHVASAFPVQYCLEISHMAAHDVDLNIVREAKLASAELEKIIHPVGPTLQLPRQQEPDDELVSENEVEEITTASRSDKRSRAEEELSEDAGSIPFVHKRLKSTATQCEVAQNGNGIELTEEDNSMNGSRANGTSHKEIEEGETTLQEQDKMRDKEQSQLDIDIPPKVTTANEECELTASLNIDTEKQHEKPEDLVSCKKDKKIEESPKISEEKSQDANVWEPIDEDLLNNELLDSINLFHNEVKSTD